MASEADGQIDARVVRELLARDKVREVIYRYCRAVDRGDEAGLRACYWPDGTDDHGAIKGPVSAFLDWASGIMPTMERGIHEIHNILLDVEPDGIAAESYFSAYDRRPNADGAMQQMLLKGRYIDWFVEREQEWRILHRLVVFDWFEQLPLPVGSEEERFGARRPIGSRWPNDPVYRWRERIAH